MCGDIGTTSRVCAFYSFTGILFTVSEMHRIGDVRPSERENNYCVNDLVELLSYIVGRGNIRL
jgi:hypothetical protein